MQSERKEKQEKPKGKLQTDIQCTFYQISEQIIFLIQRLIILLLPEDRGTLVTRAYIKESNYS